MGTGSGGYFGLVDAAPASRLQQTSTLDRINGSRALGDVRLDLLQSSFSHWNPDKARHGLCFSALRWMSESTARRPGEQTSAPGLLIGYHADTIGYGWRTDFASQRDDTQRPSPLQQ